MSGKGIATLISILVFLPSCQVIIKTRSKLAHRWVRYSHTSCCEARCAAVFYACVLFARYGSGRSSLQDLNSNSLMKRAMFHPSPRIGLRLLQGLSCLALVQIRVDNLVQWVRI